MYTTYILKSLKDENYYIGCTSNIKKRVEDHNKGLVKSTKHRIPLELIYTEHFKTLGEARQRENKIKSFKGGNAFHKLINHGSVPK